ncbi:unnamed protein product [Prorocentrum cordatum]|uniref:Uncharacterized protein n=1 Tax=Prorocentrum cordatum TaxID=2364126 RepID=A0ABN9SJT4_9DINO|nr:unnamed protein product [Polarella glacialis]
MSLPSPQNQEVLGTGIHKVFLKETECIYEGVYRFHVRRLDKSVVPFDFRDAYDDAYHHYKDMTNPSCITSRPPSGLQYCRTSSSTRRDDAQGWYHGARQRAVGSGVLTWEQAAVQHFPVPLESVVVAFLNENQLKMDKIMLLPDEDRARLQSQGQGHPRQVDRVPQEPRALPDHLHG